MVRDENSVRIKRIYYILRLRKYYIITNRNFFENAKSTVDKNLALYGRETCVTDEDRRKHWKYGVGREERVNG